MAKAAMPTASKTCLALRDISSASVGAVQPLTGYCNCT